MGLCEFVGAFKIAIMFSMLGRHSGRQDPNFWLNGKPAKGFDQPQREFGMRHPPAAPIVPGKAFANPNYVNKFGKGRDVYQKILEPADKSVNLSKNFCHRRQILFDCKTKCPELAPNVTDEEEEEKSLSVTEPISNNRGNNMCFENISTHNKHRKREYTPKQDKPMGKQSRQNLKRKEISESMDGATFQNISNNSSGSSFTTKPQNIILKDFLPSKPISDIHLVLRRMDHIEIPTNKGKEMLVTITASLTNCTRQYSLPRSLPNIILGHKENEVHKDEEKDNSMESNSAPSRTRLPSLCESEDSFVMFEKDDLESIDDDISFESCSEDSDQENDSKEAEDSDFDDIDSSFSFVNQKKVRFAPNEDLCEVHPMVKWSFAYQAARKGPWEMYARDRCRFRERAHRVERDIKHVFDPQHRGKIYRERFENL